MTAATTTPPAPPPEPQLRPFADVLRSLKGGLPEELAAALHDLVHKVTTTGGPGKLVLTLTVKPAGKGIDGAVTVGHEVALKAPQLRRPESICFIDPQGNLTRNNPTQPELPLRLADAPSGGSLKEAPSRA
jgi:hypothetical protein